MKIYMAGNLFTAAERTWNKLVAAGLRNLGHEVFLPQESEANLKEHGPQKIFQMDVSGISWSQAVVAWVEGPDPDSGTCWEIGYANGRGKKTVAYTTDLRYQGADNSKYDLNLMITQSVDKMIRLKPDVNPLEVARAIDVELKKK